MNSILPKQPYSQDVVSIFKAVKIQPFVGESHPLPFCFVFIFSLYSAVYFSVHVSKLRSNGVQNVISDISQFGLLFIFEFSVFCFGLFLLVCRLNRTSVVLVGQLNPVIRLCLTAMTMKSVGRAGFSLTLVCQSVTLVLCGLTICGRSLTMYHAVRQG